MKKVWIILLLLNALYIFGHPHVFIDINIELKDSNKAKIIWTFDLIESSNKIYYFDDDGDGLLNKQENENLFNEGFKSVKDYHYFITTKSGGNLYPVDKIENFQTEVLDDGRLSISFIIDLPEFGEDDKISITHFDTTYFISFSEPVLINNINDNLYSLPLVNRSKPYYYDPASPRDVILDTSKPKPGWVKAYPTELFISKKPIIKSFDDYDISFREKLNQGQKFLYKNLSYNLNRVKEGNNPKLLISILLVALLYGVVHAVGPGHRKIVISSYILSRDKISYIQTVLISLGSALIHSGSGIISVLVLTSIFGKVAPSAITDLSTTLERISFIFLLLLALTLLIFKLLKTFRKKSKKKNNRLELSFILLSSLVPCPGAITIMLFASTLKIKLVGILAVLFMSLGIGLTLTVISLLTIKGKSVFKSRHLSSIFEWTGLLIILVFSVFMLIPAL